VHGRASKRAAAVLADVVKGFAAHGYRQTARSGPLEARLEADGRPALRLSMRSVGGRVFGGTFALEVATADALFPRTRGVTARGRGVVRLRTIEFRGRSRDKEGDALARRLGEDERLVHAIADVHFERIRIDPDGRPALRHMGGSLVWFLFPPMTRPVPLVPAQVHATVRAMEAFAAAAYRGRRSAG